MNFMNQNALRFLAAPNPDRPLYNQLSEELIAYLQQAHYQSGDHFLSYRRIAEAANVSRITAQKAVKNMIAAGFLQESGRNILVAKTAGRSCSYHFGVILSPWDKLQCLAWDNGIILASMLETLPPTCRLEPVPYLQAQRSFLEFSALIEHKKFDLLIWIGMRKDIAVNAALLIGRIPQLCLQSRVENLAVPLLSEDNFNAAVTAFLQLRKEGARRIAVIHSPEDISSYKQRLAGVRHAMTLTGASETETLFFEFPETPRSKWYFYALQAFLKEKKPDSLLLLTHIYEELQTYYDELPEEFPPIITFEPPMIVRTPVRHRLRYFIPDYKELGRQAILDAPSWSLSNGQSYEKLLPMTLHEYLPDEKLDFPAMHSLTSRQKDS